MNSIPPVKAVMTPFPYWVDIDEPMTRAKAMMAEHEIRHLPVMSRGSLVSVLSDRDVARVAETNLGTRIREVCVTGPYTVGLSEPLDRVLAHMAGHHLDCVVVVKDDKLAGIFTVSDACRQFSRLLRSLFPGGGDSAA